MKTYCFYLIAMALIVLSACAEKRPVPGPQSHRPPGISRPVPDQRAAVRPVQRPRPKALVRMVENAQKQLRRRQPQLAFSTLEQALHIDGQDPLVWHLMARAQLDQGHIVQAVSLAKKSNSLAAAYPKVREKNAALLRQAQGRAD